MLAAISVIFQGVLWASAAVAAPVVIHLIMRTRPRTITLPTMQFVRKSHRATVSRQKLKHLLLLLLRMLAVLLIVLIVARALLPGAGAATAQGEPTAVVVVVDNSASMGYRLDGRSLLDRGKDQATAVIDALPTGSRVGLVTTDGRGSYDGFMRDLAFASEQLHDVPPGQGGRPLGDVLPRALAMLARQDDLRGELLIVTDNTAPAWRAIQAMEMDGVAVMVLDVGVEEDTNVALGPVETTATMLPVGVPLGVRTTIGGEHVGGEQIIDVLAGDRPPERVVAAAIAGQTRPVQAAVLPVSRGTLHGQVILRTPDPLAVDNVRYFAVDVGPPATVLIVSSQAEDDPTAPIMAAAAAPPLPPEEGGLPRREVAAERFASESLRGVSLVVLANAAALRDGQWELLGRFVNDGGALWVVPGSLTAADAYSSAAAQKVLPARPGEAQHVDRPLAEPDLTHPMIAPFADPENPPLGDVRIRRRVALTDRAEDAAVVLADAADEPLILRRRLGKGHVVLWATSPAAGWSNLAELGGQLVVLARATVDTLLGRQGQAKQYDWGSTIALPLPAGVDSPMVRLDVPGRYEPLMLEANLRQGIVRIVADQLGGYTAHFTRGTETLTRGLAVNTPATESDLSRIAPETLHDAFGESLLVVRSAEQRAEMLSQASGPLDLLPLLFVLLMAVLVGESFFANRFYRNPPDAPARA
jgi:hypothetical protein